MELCFAFVNFSIFLTDWFCLSRCLSVGLGSCLAVGGLSQLLGLTGGRQPEGHCHLGRLEGDEDEEGEDEEKG
jgi:hypothetical protein